MNLMDTAPKLIVRTSSGVRFEFQLTRPITTIGRAPQCDLVLDDHYVSRLHAVIRQENEGFVLYDEESRNGTRVRRLPVSDRYPIQDGDEIQIGSIHMIFQAHPETTSATAVWEQVNDDQPLASLRIDTETYDVWIDGVLLEKRLSPLEFKLLAYLHAKRGAVCSREELGDAMWGKGAYTQEMIHQVVHRLKQRIEPDPSSPRYMLTVPGGGYRLREIPSSGQHL